MESAGSVPLRESVCTSGYVGCDGGGSAPLVVSSCCCVARSCATHKCALDVCVCVRAFGVTGTRLMRL